jgi:alpha-tubulin suppressor-like RCC1 family protein
LFHSAGVRTDGTLWGWGANDPGPFGDPSGGTHTVPFRVGTDTDWSVVSSGGADHTVALKTDGSLWMLLDHPVQVGAGHSWVAIDAGWELDVAIRSDGTLWTFGRSAPLTQVGTAGGWVTASSGNGHFLAVRADGSLWAWGDNDDGELGDGTTTYRPTPVQVGLGRQWVDAAAGFDHSIAIAK